MVLLVHTTNSGACESRREAVCMHARMHADFNPVGRILEAMHASQEQFGVDLRAPKKIMQANDLR
jgi:hypothetical protein